MDRSKYNAYVGALETIMRNRGAAPTYEQAVAIAASRYAGVSPQEISGTLYNLYGQYGPRPGARYMPSVPAPRVQGGGYSGGGTRYSGGTRSTGTRYSGGGGGTRAAGPSRDQLAKAKEAYNKTVAAIMRKKSAQILAYEDMITDILKKQKDLGKEKQQGLESNESYFSRISPDAYQSQIGNYNQKVLDTYAEGMATLDRNKTRTEQAKGNFIADINDLLWNAAQEYKGNLGGYRGSNTNVAPVVVPNEPLKASPLNVSTYNAPVQLASGPNQINRGVPVNPWEFLK